MDYTTQLFTIFLLPTLLVGITIIPLQSILTPWCCVSGQSVDVFPLWLLLPHSSYSLTIHDWLFSSTDCFFRTDFSCRNPCLKVDLVGPDTEHLASSFIFHRNDIIASETSVMLANCIGVDLFSVQLTVAWVPEVERIRYHGYICSTPTLRSNGTVFPAFG
jgi:hypothetical protein